MIRIDYEKCIGCGKCVRDCFTRDIEIGDGKATTKNKACIECGHCVAICPMNAVTLDHYSLEDIVDCSAIETTIEPDKYLNHLKARRTIRNFTDAEVSKEDIRLILEAGRFSPTGGNLQNVAYYISQSDVAHLKDRIISELYETGKQVVATGETNNLYANYWLDMYEDYKKDGTDRLFFDAGTVMIISSDSPQSAIIAAAHMETMIYSMGLGMLYSGFTARAINKSEELRQYLKLKDGYQVYAVLVVGHPNVEYVRTVPRKPAEVIWN